jgi:hypothetical protein
MKEEAPRTWRKIHFIALAVVLLIGVIMGSVFFPTVREVPVVRIVEQRIEVPVDRVVEKRIEVPVDRVVEKRIEVPVDRVVEKVVVQRVEISGPERVVVRYVSDRTKEINGKPSYVISEDRLKLWMQIKPGMTRQQVVDVLGPPDGEPGSSYEGVLFRWGKGSVFFGAISSGGVVKWVISPEY